MEVNQLLIEAAEPLVMYLRKTCNPHVKVIVDQTGAEAFEGILSTGVSFDGSLPEGEPLNTTEQVDGLSELESYIDGLSKHSETWKKEVLAKIAELKLKTL